MASSISSADLSSHAALAMQRAIASASDRQKTHELMQQAQAGAQERLKALQAAEQAYGREMSQPVFTMELEDGTQFQVMRGGGVSGSGPRGALVMGLNDMVRDAGFPEPKTREEAMMQKIVVLQLHFGSEEVRDATRKFLETAKKAIALLSQMVQMLQEGWKSGAIPLRPVKGGDGDDVLKIWSSGAHIMAGSGNDLVYADHYSKVEAGDGDDTVIAGEQGGVYGGAGDDMISVQSNSHVSGGAGHDTIRLRGSQGSADGGAGNDVIDASGNSRVTGGDGDDILDVGSDSSVDGGAGNDVIKAWSNSTANGGTGDDLIKAWSDTVVDGGEGDDLIDAWSDSTVEGGAGNDRISVWSDSTASGGAGDDLISGWSGSTIDGGAGNDVLQTTRGAAYGGAGDDTISGSGLLDGGEGNDVLVSNLWASSISGGRGDDQIVATGETSIAFGRGDGRDTVAGKSLQYYDGAKIAQDGGTGLTTRQASVTFNLGQGLSRQDMQISVSGNDMKLDFGGGDSITIQDYRNMSATMVFADGSKMQVADFVASGTPLTPPGRAVDLQA